MASTAPTEGDVVALLALWPAVTWGAAAALAIFDDDHGHFEGKGILAMLHTWEQPLVQPFHLHGLVSGAALGRLRRAGPGRQPVAPGEAGGPLPGAGAGARLPGDGPARPCSTPLTAGRSAARRASRAGPTERASGRSSPPSAGNEVVYAKPSCGGREQVLKYLARYTYRPSPPTAS